MEPSDDVAFGCSSPEAFRGNEEQLDGAERTLRVVDHPHDDIERGRWGSDTSDHPGHVYEGGKIDDTDRHRPDELLARLQPPIADRGQALRSDGRGYGPRDFGRGYATRGYPG